MNDYPSIFSGDFLLICEEAVDNGSNIVVKYVCTIVDLFVKILPNQSDIYSLKSKPKSMFSKISNVLLAIKMLLFRALQHSQRIADLS